MRKRRVVRRIYGMKYSWMGHKERNRHKNRINSDGQARLDYVFDINHNIPTTWRWARGDSDDGHTHYTLSDTVTSCFLKTHVSLFPTDTSDGKNDGRRPVQRQLVARYWHYYGWSEGRNDEDDYFDVSSQLQDADTVTDEPNANMTKTTTSESIPLRVTDTGKD